MWAKLIQFIVVVGSVDMILGMGFAKDKSVQVCIVSGKYSFLLVTASRLSLFIKMMKKISFLVLLSFTNAASYLPKTEQTQQFDIILL